MKKFIIPIVILLCMVILFIPRLVEKSALEGLKNDKAKLYGLAFDAVWEIDSGLNGNIKYVNIESKNLKGLGAEEKKQLFKYIAAKYKVKMLDMSFEMLQKKGYIKNLRFKDGIIFKVHEYSKYKNDAISFSGSKWRSGLGAIGFAFEGVKENGLWKVKSCKMTWIS